MPHLIVQSLLVGSVTALSLSDNDLRLVYEHAVTTYRAFEPVFTDEYFDAELAPEFAGRFPSDALVVNPEPESSDTLDGERVKHEIPMLSTEKVYTLDALKRFASRIEDAGISLGMAVEDVRVRATPKLDGIAGVINSSGQLLTRGQDGYGFDITRGFDRGMAGSREPGVGEIVLGQSTFLKLKETDPDMKHPRNVVGGVMSADTLKPVAIKALESGDVRFLRYGELPFWEGTVAELLGCHEEIKSFINEFDFCLTDGVVVEAVDARIKEHLGATSHHHRWQIALKSRGETADTVVTAITTAVGRTGKITPVIEYESIFLSGAELNKVTGHSISLLNQRGINVGARILVVRSGEVIPHCADVLIRSDEVFTITHCPSCQSELVQEDVDMICPNSVGCPAQAQRTLTHFFQRMKINGFGPSTVTQLVGAGYADLISVYGMTQDEFASVIGGKQADNLFGALEASIVRPIDDWVLLSALGITHLGRGDSRHLLAAFKLADLESITADNIQTIKGFGSVTSPSIANGLRSAWNTLQYIIDQGYSVIPTPLLSEAEAVESPIAGLSVVFTGAMIQGNRDEMKAQARELGAVVQGGVNGKTSVLICGSRVGATKINKAESLGVRVISEEDYLRMIA